MVFISISLHVIILYHHSSNYPLPTYWTMLDLFTTTITTYQMPTWQKDPVGKVF